MSLHQEGKSKEEKSDDLDIEIKRTAFFDIIKVKPDTPKTNNEIFTNFDLDVVKFLRRRTELVLLASHFFGLQPLRFVRLYVHI